MTVQNRARVLIVDDSAVMRSVISRTLSASSDIEVVGKVENGEIAVNSIKSLDPDIVILDIEMPVMDGITALPLILKEKPSVKVLICSTLSARGADISVRALSLGATECILKPGSDTIISAKDFQDSLLRLVRTLAFKDVSKSAVVHKPKFTLQKKVSVLPPKILAIGSSTGGPKALMDLMVDLKNLPVPIVITQHMPKNFTAMLAKHITDQTGIPTQEGAPGMLLKAGCAYVAPGGYHMTLHKVNENVIIRLNEDPPENYCRPSVNPMLRSLIPIYGDRILAVILTGMGCDGSQACADVANRGGRVIAQDEATSVVWGMPGAVANAGLCSAVLPINEIHAAIKTSLRGLVV